LLTRAVLCCTFRTEPRPTGSGRAPFHAVAALALFLASLTLPSIGQEDLVFRADLRLVVLHTTVVDRNGKLLTDLPQAAFKVYENNVEQELRLFRHEDVPISLGLILDNSASMREKRQKVAAAALQLVKASNPQDEVFIVNFNDFAYLDSPFTNSIPKLEEGLARIDSRGTTAMRDAIGMSINYMKSNARLDKKILLVITDGDDNLSELTPEQIMRQAQQAEVLIYAIGLLSEEDRGSARQAKKALDMITEASGGAPYYPQDLAEVDQIALRVAHEIRNQFTIGYSPSQQTLDGSFRQIRVIVDGPNRPVARTRTGYYATPEARSRPPASSVPAK
jgi:Ca-activated chloride channel homolog